MTPELGAKDFNAKEAFKESLQQMKDMREGKIKKTTWDDFMKELKEEGYLDQMCYTVIQTPNFKKDIKYYLKKHYMGILDVVKEIVDEVESGNLVGEVIQDLKLPAGEDTYKVRAVNPDLNKGKSGGYRIIYYAIKNDKEAYMLSIYSKKDSNRILEDRDIVELIKEYCS